MIVHEPSDASAIRAKLLVLTGGADPMVPDTKVAEWQDEMRAVPSVDWQVVTYSSAMHAFAVPAHRPPGPRGAVPGACRPSLVEALQVFLAEVFD